MKNLIIIGAGDFAREVVWLVNRINSVKQTWNLLGFVDDSKAGSIVDNIPVLDTIDWLTSYQDDVYVACAIGAGKVREYIWNMIKSNPQIHAATLIDPAAIIGRSCFIGTGCIICAGAVLTINVHLGQNCIVNLNSTIGHDAILEDYCTLHPSVNVSGHVHLGAHCTVGTGSQIIQGLAISNDVILGAGTVVVKALSSPGTYIGVPARRIK